MVRKASDMVKNKNEEMCKKHQLSLIPSSQATIKLGWKTIFWLCPLGPNRAVYCAIPPSGNLKVMINIEEHIFYHINSCYRTNVP